MKQMTLATIHSPSLTGQRCSNNESLFGGWSLPNPLLCFCHKRSKPAKSDEMAKLDTKMWDRGMLFTGFYSLKYSAPPTCYRRALPLRVYRSQLLSNPKHPLAKSNFDLKGETGSEHLLWRPQITLLLIKPWSERRPETHGQVSPLWPSPMISGNERTQGTLGGAWKRDEWA